MSWKNTWILVGLAGALFAFIVLVERRLDPTGAVREPEPLIAKFKTTAATAVQIRRGAQFVINLERTNDGWRFTKKLSYPAATFPVQRLLEHLAQAVPSTRISAREILSHKQSAADFGLDSPAIVVSLEQGGDRRELRFGARTPAGDQIYVQVGSDPSVYVVGAELLDRLPRTVNDWRDTSLFHLAGQKVDRAEISHSGGGFKLALDATNQQWRLIHPPHRADQDAVNLLLKQVLEARALEFVTDTETEVEAFGFQAPAYEVTLGAAGGSQRIQIGKPATNDAGRVYARLMAHTNVVLVPKALLDLLATPYSELRERQLAPFAPEMVDSIEARGDENFVLRKSGPGWVVDETPVDSLFVERWLLELSRLKASEFVKDVVTDFTPYGLEPPLRQYTLRMAVTNAVGPTNVLVARFDFGGPTPGGLIYAKRWDENSVYSIPLVYFSRMPSAPWQLRTHRVWNFTTNQITSLTVQEGQSVRQAVRQANGEWVPVKGWTENINPFALEEIAVGLGQLHTEAWMARGAGVREQFGFKPGGTRLSVELRGGEKPQVLAIELIMMQQLPYGLMDLNGQPVVFEFPWPLYGDLQRYFHISAPSPRAGQ